MKRLSIHCLPVVGLVLLASGLWAQEAEVERIRITQADHLPARSYDVAMPPSEMLADDEVFLRFARRVGDDLRTDLARFEIEDVATVRAYLRTLGRIALLGGRYDEALQHFERVRQLEERPAARLTSGLVEIGLAESLRDGSGDVVPAFRARFATALSSLPFEQVETDVRQMRLSAATLSEGLVRGGVQARLDPAAAGGSLSAEMARGLIGSRVSLELVPLAEVVVAAVDNVLARHAVERVDIWAEREFELQPHQVAAPVVVGIWDTGVDVDVFPGRLYVDPDPVPGFPAHGISFDLDLERSAELLYTAGGRERFAQCPYRGIGTSMAAPQVANLAAKLLALDPGLSVAELRRLILEGAEERVIGEGRAIRLLHPARSVEMLEGANRASSRSTRARDGSASSSWSQAASAVAVPDLTARVPTDAFP